MKRIYRFKWFNKKDKLERTTYLKIPNASGNVGTDAKRALNIFISSFGNLKKNEIIKIQELDEEYNQIGEDITPMEEENIVPIRR